MATALFRFDDRAHAAQAAQRLVDQGLPQQAVSISAARLEPAAGDLDEAVTGGFIHSAHELLEGLFEWGTPGQDKAAYSDTVERGGAVLRVRAESPAEQTQVDQVLQACAVRQRTGWSAAH